MPRGKESKYTDKQERKADHIAQHYKSEGVGPKEAERRAWATVNKDAAAARPVIPPHTGEGKRVAGVCAPFGSRTLRFG